MAYRLMWLALASQITPDEVRKIRSQIFQRSFSALKWVPYPSTDRVWDTRTPARRGYRRLPEEPSGQPAPRVALFCTVEQSDTVGIGPITEEEED